MVLKFELKGMREHLARTTYFVVFGVNKSKFLFKLTRCSISESFPNPAHQTIE